MSNNWRTVNGFLLGEELLDFHRLNNFLTEYSEYIDEGLEMNPVNPFYLPLQVDMLQLNLVLNINQDACLYVRDYISNRKFLVDTGACLSIYPRKLVPQRKILKCNRNINLKAANGSPIATYGTTKIRLNFGLGRVFKWNFTIADTDELIIGADFLYNFGIMVDIRNRRIFLNNETNE